MYTCSVSSRDAGKVCGWQNGTVTIRHWTSELLDSNPMNIEMISLTVLDLPGRTSFFSLARSHEDGRFYWRSQSRGPTETQIHVLHVRTSNGVEGVCTVGDARYSSLRADELEFMRWLAVGQDALDRRGLRDRLHYATRHAFLSPGWYGALDNCLWDIAGQVADQPVHLLIGSCREQSEAYYNVRSGNLDTALSDADRALQDGFVAIKDHFSQPWQRNAKWLRALRHQTGEGVDLMHDAAGCQYTFEEALAIGKVLEEEGFLWFEEPLPDRSLVELQMLCQALSIPVMALETLMHDLDLSRAWLQVRATDLVRGNARIGTTSLLDLASFAAQMNTSVELNGSGGLFGLLHAHLTCAIPNTSRYEYFPGGSRDTLGLEIGLLNAPVPRKGMVTPPNGPGWGAEWDWDRFRAKTVAIL